MGLRVPAGTSHWAQVGDVWVKWLFTILLAAINPGP